MDNAADRIIPLDQLDDYKVADGDPDVRGWDVLSADGRRIGEVDNLLVDTGAMKVRYLDVEMDDDLIEGEGSRHILIPIGYARLDEEDDQIMVDTLDSHRIGQLPAYQHGALTREFETDLQTHFGGGLGVPGTTGVTTTPTDLHTDRYAGEMYDENRFYGSRRIDRGGQRLTNSDEEL
jgi:sporulation protein YlmC with PRC-barrel domain